MSGMLTEEQVRKAIRKHAHDDSCYIFEVYGEMYAIRREDLSRFGIEHMIWEWHESYKQSKRLEGEVFE